MTGESLNTAEFQEYLDRLNVKFTVFIQGLLELNEVRRTLYEHLNQKIAASMDTLGEDNWIWKGKTFTGKVEVDPEDPSKLISAKVIICEYRGSIFGERLEPLNDDRGETVVFEELDKLIDQIEGSKIPEPEVLITVQGINGKLYKISQIWVEWHNRIFPEYTLSQSQEMGGLRIANKYFRQTPTDLIERKIATYRLPEDTDGIQIEFYRTTRVKL